MEKTHLKIISAWAGGILKSNSAGYVYDISIDSRNVSENSLFFCIKGEKDDGHRYIEEARNAGGYSIGEKDNCDIKVESTIRSLGAIASKYRETLQVKTIGVTGSNGKTTTIRLIEEVLKHEYKVVASEKSYNNELGVPLSVLRMDTSTQFGVFELGANHLNEIKTLTKIIKPVIGVITNVGEAHIGCFGSKEKIVQAKFELADEMDPGSTLICNYDQKDLSDKIKEYINKLKILGFGSTDEAEFRFDIIEQNSEKTRFSLKEHKFELGFPGAFNVYNAAAAIAVGSLLKIKYENIIEYLKDFRKIPHRMNKVYVNKYEIIDDSYNSNPSSLKILFDELLKIYPQKNIIAIVGEMLELGEFSDKMHRETGKYISDKPNVKALIVSGKYKEDLAEGARMGHIDRNNIYKIDDMNGIKEIIEKLHFVEQLLVIKASRRQNFERLLDILGK